MCIKDTHIQKQTKKYEALINALLKILSKTEYTCTALLNAVAASPANRFNFPPTEVTSILVLICVVDQFCISACAAEWYLDLFISSLIYKIYVTIMSVLFIQIIQEALFYRSIIFFAKKKI